MNIILASENLPPEVQSDLDQNNENQENWDVKRIGEG